jgi:hypothetical protein
MGVRTPERMTGVSVFMRTSEGRTTEERRRVVYRAANEDVAQGGSLRLFQVRSRRQKREKPRG